MTFSFLMGGRAYADVDNMFQFAKNHPSGKPGNPFNVLSVSEGFGVLTLNFGSGYNLGDLKATMLWVDYNLDTKLRTNAHAMQVGVQRQF
jgi:hypothetical protein